MERCFIIDKSSKLYRKYAAWKENFEENCKIVKDFLCEHDISPRYFCFDKEALYIVPTDESLTKYKNQFKKQPEAWLRGKGSLYVFKKNSPVGKAYTALDLTVLTEPMPAMYIDEPIRRVSWRLFIHDEVLYVTLESDDITVDTEFPTDWKEMKRSDFYKILENMEEEE